MAASNSGLDVGRAIFIGLSAVVVLAPIPLGSARPLAWDVLGLAIAALLLLSLFSPPGTQISFPRDLRPPLVAIALVIGFVVLQASELTPEAWHNPIWRSTSDTLALPLTGAVAVNPYTAFVGILRYTMYVGVFYLAHFISQCTVRAYTALKILALSGTGYAAYGLIVFGLGNKTLLWLHKWAYVEDLTGTFVNRNSFATFLGLSLLATLSQLLIAIAPPPFYGSKRDELIARIEFLSARAWIFLCLFVQASALFLTHSRAGNLVTLVGATSLLLAFSLAPHGNRFRQWTLAIIPASLVLVALLISGERVLTRFLETDIDADGRFAIYRLTARGISDNWLLGTGLGSFASVFPMYRTDAVPAGFINAAHNDYLENLLELGIPAAFLLFAALAWLVYLCVRGVLTRRRDIIFPCFGVGASLLVGLHALVDFSLQIPAVTITYLFILGIAVGQSRSSSTNPTN